MTARLGSSPDIVARPLRPTTGTAGLASQYFDLLPTHIESMTPTSAITAIDQRLTDIDLTPEQIAAAAGVRPHERSV